MKFSGLLLILLLLTFLTACSGGIDPKDLTADMTFEEYASVVPKEARYDWMGHSFFQTKDGQSVVVEFHEHECLTIEQVHVFEPAVCTEEKAKTFAQGADLFDLIRTLGFPYSIEENGVTLVFIDENETRYRFSFDSGYHSYGYHSYQKPYDVSDEALALLVSGMAYQEICDLIGGTGVDSTSAKIAGERWMIWQIGEQRYLDVAIKKDDEGVWRARSAKIREKNKEHIILF